MLLLIYGRLEDDLAENGNGQAVVLADCENVLFLEKVRSYFAGEVLPRVPDAWIDDESKRLTWFEQGYARFYVIYCYMVYCIVYGFYFL